jgi:hypothetical protein
MSMNMGDWVGLSDFIPSGDIQVGPGFSAQAQMFGMDGVIPGAKFAHSPGSSVYSRQQMFGMGLGAVSVEEAKGELAAIQAKRASIADQIEAIKNKGKRTVTRFAPGEPHPAAPSKPSGAQVVLVLGGLAVAWKLFGPKSGR